MVGIEEEIELVPGIGNSVFTPAPACRRQGRENTVADFGLGQRRGGIRQS